MKKTNIHKPILSIETDCKLFRVRQNILIEKIKLGGNPLTFNYTNSKI